MRESLAQKKRKVLIMIRMKPHESVVYGFVILFQESWMIRTCTGSHETQQLWQIEPIYHYEKTIIFNSLSRILFSFSSSIIFFPMSLPAISGER